MTAVTSSGSRRTASSRRRAERHGIELGVDEHDERQEEVVPDRHELEQVDRHERRGHEPHAHGEEDPHVPGAVEPPGLDELVGHGPAGVDARQVDAERAHEAREEHRPVGVRELHLAEQEEERQRERRRGHEHAGEDDPEQHLAPAELVLGQRVAAMAASRVPMAAPTPA
jgi:hypothetical protein